MKLFTGTKVLPKGSYYIGVVKELIGATTLNWIDGILQLPNTIQDAEQQKPKRKRTAKKDKV